ncbi:hypothetical protein [Natrarchaeobaculum sulfurireducens]|uniref:Uncharacterized protein n=1 Tax=Natrarchaeobaculum sulfurireducens TaxID=2044521 RepID=A0A346PJN5_9EURY|nr:hypothetical protein [Natrarchaeobaculum sulfurireducens]AXR79730.1 hypothetical protein AArc1_3437 [Natrarchaeobaculum sulfurireducens]AXR83470.1 hypothetical protein AArcMg_3496 [Natrarchaeobaculum sulfurireducens]
MNRSRRDVLEFAAATATVAAFGLAGPSAVSAQDDDLLTYTDWLETDDSLEFVAVDWASVAEYVTDELEAAQPGEAVPTEYEADPMVAPVSEGMLSAYFVVGLDLAQYGLGGLLDEDAFDTTVEDVIQTAEMVVLAGDIQREEIDDRLTAEPELEFVRQLEQTDEVGDDDVYTPVEGNDVAIGVGDDALVVVDEVDEPTARLERAIEVSAGDDTRAVEASESLEWLVETAGDGDVVVGQYGDRVATADALVDMTYAELEDAEGIVSSLTVVDEETSTGEFAAIVDDPDEVALEDLLGISADEASVDVDGDRVTATGTWRADVTVTRLRGGAR